MQWNEDFLQASLSNKKSLRAAWQNYCGGCGHVAWDTFRKKANSYKENFGVETPKPQDYKVGLALYDLHMPYESEEVLSLAEDYVKYQLGFRQLDYLILGGDIVTCDAVSRWSKDPYSVMAVHEEIAYAKEGLQNLLDRFNPKETFYIKGNHEARLENYLLTKAPEVSRLNGITIQEQLGLDALGITWVDNLDRKSKGQPFFHIGQLSFAHGHEFKTAPQIAPARQYFLKTLAPMMVGHVHRVDEHFFRTIENKVLGTWVCGCSCSITQDYLPANQWLPGFAVIKWFPDGLFEVQLKKVIGGRTL